MVLTGAAENPGTDAGAAMLAPLRFCCVLVLGGSYCRCPADAVALDSMWDSCRACCLLPVFGIPNSYEDMARRQGQAKNALMFESINVEQAK
jgi:hypothetical protein